MAVGCRVHLDQVDDMRRNACNRHSRWVQQHVCGDMDRAQFSKTDVLFRCCLQNFREVFPSLISAAGLPSLVKTGDVDWDGVDAAFCCLPHATTQASGCP